MGVRDGTGALTGVAVTVTVDVVTGGSTPSPPPPHPVVARGHQHQRPTSTRRDDPVREELHPLSKCERRRCFRRDTPRSPAGLGHAVVSPVIGLLATITRACPLGPAAGTRRGR